MNTFGQLVVFGIEEQRYALRLGSVERIVRAVAITPLPQAPAIVLGVVDVRGEIVPVVNVRARFHLPPRDVHLTDHFILGRTTRRRVALVVDSVAGVMTYPAEAVVSAEKILPGLEYLEGVARLSDGLILIHDLEKFLSLEEEQAIQEAMLPT